MNDTSSLSHLIECLEKATGPDRELDILIGQATPVDGWRVLDDGTCEAWVSGDADYSDGWMMAGELPHYTSSIDAAMTLLPDDVYWMAACGKRSVNEPLGACALYHPGVDNPFVQVEGHTVAIAFCIAALKAQLSTRTNEQDDARNLSGVSSE